MKLMQRLPWLLSFAAILGLMAIPVAVPSVSAYSGGFYDDGLYDDDWYFDYYDWGGDGDGLYPSMYSSTLYENNLSDPAGLGAYDGDDEYDATQFYDDAGESGLFDV